MRTLCYIRIRRISLNALEMLFARRQRLIWGTELIRDSRVLTDLTSACGVARSRNQDVI